MLLWVCYLKPPHVSGVPGVLQTVLVTLQEELEEEPAETAARVSSGSAGGSSPGLESDGFVGILPTLLQMCVCVQSQDALCLGVSRDPERRPPLPGGTAGEGSGLQLNLEPLSFLHVVLLLCVCFCSSIRSRTTFKNTEERS